MGIVRARSCSAAASPSSRRAGRTPAAIWRRSVIAEPTSPTIWSSAGARMRASLRQRALHAADLEAERDEPLLRAVVEVALEPAALLVARLDDAHARGLHLLELQAHLDAQARDLDRERGRRRGCRAARSRRSSSAGSCSSTAVRSALARDLRVRAPVVGQRARRARPSRSRTSRSSGSQKTSSASGSRSASREHAADLLGRAQPLAHLVLERLHGAQAVRARAVEAAVDDALDARAQRAEGERDDERAGGGHPVRAAADRDARRRA